MCKYKEYCKDYTKEICDRNYRGLMGSKEINEKMFFNLLAYIHRDGGHYVSKHGTIKAYEDAVKKICDWREASQPAVEADAERWWEGGFCPDCGWEMAHDPSCKFDRTA